MDNKAFHLELPEEPKEELLELTWITGWMLEKQNGVDILYVNGA